jgi:phosphatidylserine/phosphatidylglycerophosphate/cardiolipin synthase-like enzyme
VITGSYNLIRDSEENNAENLVFLDGAELAKTYADNWRTHAGHSVEFAPSR